jgi:vitamin B12 transporter
MKKISYSPKRAAVALAVCALVASNAQAQTLKDVVVTPTGSEQSLAQALPATLLIGREDIEQSQVRDLPQALRMLAGVDVGQTGPSGSQTSIFLRGGESRNTLVLIDGVPLNRGDFGTASLQYISAEQIERIEIVRGNVSALYGSAAVGGVIQVFTRQHNQPSVSAEVGSRGNYRMSVGAGLRTDTTRLSVGATSERAGGYSAKDPLVSLGADTDTDRGNATSLSLGAQHDLAKGHTLSARLLTGRNKTDYDGSGPSDRLDAKTQLIGLRSENALSSAWSSKLDLSQSTERFTDATGFITDGKNRSTQLQWDNTVKLAPNHSLQLGLEHKRIRFDDNPSTGFQPRRVNAVRLGYVGQQDALSWQANLRHDRTSDFGNASTYYLGLGYALTPQLKLLGSVSTAFNAPSFIDLASQDQSLPPLQAERARSRELGVQYNAGGWLTRATVFASRQRDRIEFDPVASFAVNTGRASNKGLELSVNAPVGPGLLGVDATFQDPVNDSTGESLKRRARTNLAVNYNMDLGLWQLGGYLKYTGSRLDTDPVTFSDAVNSSYTRVDLSAQYRVAPAWTLLGRVENLGNTRRNEVLGFNSQPRSVFVGVRWSPKI